MVHVRALPGSPRGELSLDRIVHTAQQEAAQLIECGFDGVIIENMHDTPYLHARHGPEVTACMTRVGLAVRVAAGQRALVGVQVLSCGNAEAIAVAHACGLDFVRCENFVYAHVADEGVLERAEAGPLLRYRKSIGAQRVAVLCDIKKKHASHAITADLSITDVAEGALFFGADGLIVTGSATGKPTDPEDLSLVREAVGDRAPVLVGSGVTPSTAPALLQHADALIVGSSIKKNGLWSNDLDPDRCRELVRSVR